MAYLYIGLGGMGKLTLQLLLKRLKENPATRGLLGRSMAFIYIDPENTLDSDLPQDLELISVCVDDPETTIMTHLEHNPSFSEWWLDSYLLKQTICGSHGAGQIRVAGRLSFFSNLDNIRNGIEQAITVRLGIEKGAKSETALHIFVISSLGGGSGSGMFIDVGFLLLDIVEEIGIKTNTIYGIFYDGTVSAIWDNKTIYPAYASLKELEYWMVNPEKYRFVGQNGKKIGERKNKKLSERLSARPFDIVILVGKSTPSGRNLTSGSNTLVTKKRYASVVADFLYSISTLRDFNAFIEANKWNLFKQISVTKGRIPVYNAVSVSSITYEREKGELASIYKWAAEDLKNILVSTNEDFPDFEEITNEMGFNEKKDRQLRDNLRKKVTNKKGEHIAQNYLKRRDAVIKALETVGSRDELIRIFETYNLPEEEGIRTQYDQLLEEYKSYASTYLEDLKIKFLKKLDNDMLFNENEVFARSFNLEKAKIWLSGAIGFVEANIDKLNEEESGFEVAILRNMINSYKQAKIAKEKKFGFFKGDFFYHLSELKQYLERWLSQSLNKIEIDVMKKFFGELKDELQKRQNGIKKFEEGLNTIIEEFRKAENALTFRTGIIDPHRLQNREYPLELKLDLRKEVFTEHIYPLVKDELLKNKENIRNELLYSDKIKSPTGIESRGFFTWLKLCIDEAVKQTNRTFATDFQKLLLQDLSNSILTVLRRYVGPVFKNITLANVVDYLLDQVLNDARSIKSLTDRQNLINSLSETLFYDQQDVESLLNKIPGPGDVQGEKDWKKRALLSILRKVKSFSDPLLMYKDSISGVFWSGKGGEKPVENSSAIFLGQKFSNYLRQLGAENSIQVSLVKSVYSNEDEYRIILLGTETCLPLPAIVTIPTTYKSSFDSHYENWKQALIKGKSGDGRPYHADKRFYTDWDVNITDLDVPTVRFTKNAYWIYILGIGTGIIAPQKRRYYIITGEKKHTTGCSSLPELISWIESGEIPDGVKEQIIREIRSRYYVTNNFDTVLEVFKAAHQKHLKRKPGGDTASPAYRLWEEIEQLIRHDPVSGKPSADSQIPKTWKEMEEILNML